MSAWLNGKASGHKSKGLWFKAPKVGMLGCWEGREGMVGEVSRAEMKRRRRMKRRSKVPKIFIFVCRKSKSQKKKIKLTLFETNLPRLEQIDLGWNKLT